MAGQLQTLFGVRLRRRRSPGDGVGPGEAIQHGCEHADSSAEPGLVGAAFIEGSRRIKLAQVQRCTSCPQQLRRLVDALRARHDLAQHGRSAGRVASERTR